MKNIGVFLSASQVSDKYICPAKEFARLLAKNKFNLIYGGTNKGLMRVVADEVQTNGGKVIGVTMPRFEAIVKVDADEIIRAKDLAERKKIMAERSDAIVVLVGGIGTLDEATELIEHKKQAVHSKPIIFLNTAGFYSGLKAQFEKMEAEGFLPKQLGEYIHFAETPEQVFKYLSEANNI